jgi:hypothetical protein
MHQLKTDPWPPRRSPRARPPSRPPLPGPLSRALRLRGRTLPDPSATQCPSWSYARIRPGPPGVLSLFIEVYRDLSPALSDSLAAAPGTRGHENDEFDPAVSELHNHRHSKHLRTTCPSKVAKSRRKSSKVAKSATKVNESRKKSRESRRNSRRLPSRISASSPRITIPSSHHHHLHHFPRPPTTPRSARQLHSATTRHALPARGREQPWGCALVGHCTRRVPPLRPRRVHSSSADTIQRIHPRAQPWTSRTRSWTQSATHLWCA